MCGISALVGPFRARLSQRLYATLNRLRLSSLAVSYLRGAASHSVHLPIQWIEFAHLCHFHLLGKNHRSQWVWHISSLYLRQKAASYGFHLFPNDVEVLPPNPVGVPVAIGLVLKPSLRNLPSAITPIWRCGRICTSRQPVGHSVACYLHPLMPPCAFQCTSGGVFRFGRLPIQSFGLLRWRWPCHAANVAVVSLAHGLRL